MTKVTHWRYIHTVFVPRTGNPAGEVHLQKGAGRGIYRAVQYPGVYGGV